MNSYLKFFFLIISIALVVNFSFLSETNKKPPNIVLIMADDLGWSDLSYMGSNYYETPNIDKFAKSGMIFYNAYASSANCAPSRASMMTGKYHPDHGIYTVSPSDRGIDKTRKIIPTKNIENLDLDFFVTRNVKK